MSLVKGVISKPTAPTVNDDSSKGFYIGFMWVDSSARVVYQLIDDTIGNAVWSTNGVGNTSVVISSDTTIQKYNKIVFVDSSSNPVTITYPLSPDLNEVHEIIDIGNATRNNITIDGNGKNISGETNFTLIENYESLSTIYNGTQHIAI